MFYLRGPQSRVIYAHGGYTESLIGQHSKQIQEVHVKRSNRVKPLTSFGRTQVPPPHPPSTRPESEALSLLPPGRLEEVTNAALASIDGIRSSMEHFQGRPGQETWSKNLEESNVRVKATMWCGSFSTFRPNTLKQVLWGRFEPLLAPAWKFPSFA